MRGRCRLPGGASGRGGLTHVCVNPVVDRGSECRPGAGRRRVRVRSGCSTALRSGPWTGARPRSGRPAAARGARQRRDRPERPAIRPEPRHQLPPAASTCPSTPLHVARQRRLAAISRPEPTARRRSTAPGCRRQPGIGLDLPFTNLRQGALTPPAARSAGGSGPISAQARPRHASARPHGLLSPREVADHELRSAISAPNDLRRRP